MKGRLLGSFGFAKGRGLSLTNWIIIINVVLFIVFSLLIYVENSFIGVIALSGDLFFKGFVWTLLTSMFMHSGALHLFVNMFSLFFLGNLSEQIIGRKRFLWFYLLAGIGGGIVFLLFVLLGSLIPRGAQMFGSFDIFAVGASGALFGLLGLLAALIPRHKVYLIMGPLVLIVLQVIIGAFIPGAYLDMFYLITSAIIFLMIFGIFSSNRFLKGLAWPLEMPLWMAPIIAIVPLVVISFFVELPIGNSAHFGGLVVGLAYGIYLRFKYPKKVYILGKVFRR